MADQGKPCYCPACLRGEDAPHEYHLEQRPKGQLDRVRWTAHTPSGSTNCCMKHAHQIESVFRVIGVRVQFTAAPENATCANCENESATTSIAPHAAPARAGD